MKSKEEERESKQDVKETNKQKKERKKFGLCVSTAHSKSYSALNQVHV